MKGGRREDVRAGCDIEIVRAGLDHHAHTVADEVIAGYEVVIMGLKQLREGARAQGVAF